MTDELKQWEYDRGYEKGKADVLDKIRAEILGLPTETWNMVRRTRVFEIIDKYKAESEVTE